MIFYHRNAASAPLANEKSIILGRKWEHLHYWLRRIGKHWHFEVVIEEIQKKQLVFFPTPNAITCIESTLPIILWRELHPISIDFFTKQRILNFHKLPVVPNQHIQLIHHKHTRKLSPSVVLVEVNNVRPVYVINCDQTLITQLCIIKSWLYLFRLSPDIDIKAGVVRLIGVDSLKEFVLYLSSECWRVAWGGIGILLILEMREEESGLIFPHKNLHSFHLLIIYAQNTRNCYDDK